MTLRRDRAYWQSLRDLKDPEDATRYEIINKAESRINNSAFAGVFIYVLMLNPSAQTYLGPKPFYIGQTLNWRSRFAKHEQLDWHLRNLHNPTKVLIAGIVPWTVADVAEASLIQAAAAVGYSLRNEQHNQPSNSAWVQDQPLDYFHNSFRDEKYLMNWRREFLSKTPYTPDADAVVAYRNAQLKRIMQTISH